MDEYIKLEAAIEKTETFCMVGAAGYCVYGKRKDGEGND